MKPQAEEREYIEIGEQVVILSSRKGAWRMLPWAVIATAILTGMLIYKRDDLAFEICFGIGLGTVLKVLLWDCGVALISPRPRVFLDPNGLSYANAWGFTTTTLWDEVRGIHFQRFFGIFDCILIEVDMKLWRSRRGWIQHSVGGFLADQAKRSYGIETPVYFYCYRIGVSPRTFIWLAQGCAGWKGAGNPAPQPK